MCARKKTPNYTFRLYINTDSERVLGKGGAQILEAVEKYGSITAAAEELEMSYRFVWNYLARMRKRLGEPVIATHRGGSLDSERRGGGETTLTLVAKELLKEFRETEQLVQHVLSGREVPSER